MSSDVETLAPLSEEFDEDDTLQSLGSTALNPRAAPADRANAIGAGAVMSGQGVDIDRTSTVALDVAALINGQDRGALPEVDDIETLARIAVLFGAPQEARAGLNTIDGLRRNQADRERLEIETRRQVFKHVSNLENDRLSRRATVTNSILQSGGKLQVTQEAARQKRILEGLQHRNKLAEQEHAKATEAEYAFSIAREKKRGQSFLEVPDLRDTIDRIEQTERMIPQVKTALYALNKNGRVANTITQFAPKFNRVMDQARSDLKHLLNRKEGNELTPEEQKKLHAEITSRFRSVSAEMRTDVPEHLRDAYDLIMDYNARGVMEILAEGTLGPRPTDADLRFAADRASISLKRGLMSNIQMLERDAARYEKRKRNLRGKIERVDHGMDAHSKEYRNALGNRFEETK